MRKLVVLSFVSLDGVMQAPGGKGEDPSGGFHLEGWTVPYFDDVAQEEMGKQIKPPFDLLLGHKTYEIFAGYWPNHLENDIGQLFAKAKKYVVSHEQLDTHWDETIQIHGDVAEEIRKLKQEDGPMLQVHGSSDLIQTLLEHALIDELWLKTFPVTLGMGKKLFEEGTKPAAFKLLDSKTTPKGVIIANYERAGEVETGTF